MIIESHAHYANNCYKKPFRYLTRDENGYSLAKDLWETVRHFPLDRILIETEAPFILPYCKDTLPPKLLRRTRNSSMVLPEVIKKIAEIKDISIDAVESSAAENVTRLFRLPI